MCNRGNERVKKRPQYRLKIIRWIIKTRFEVAANTYVTLQDQKYIMLRFLLLELDTYSSSWHVDEYFQQVSYSLDENWIFCEFSKFKQLCITIDNILRNIALYCWGFNAGNYLSR